MFLPWTREGKDSRILSWASSSPSKHTRTETVFQETGYIVWIETMLPHRQMNLRFKKHLKKNVDKKDRTSQICGKDK